MSVIRAHRGSGAEELRSEPELSLPPFESDLLNCSRSGDPEIIGNPSRHPPRFGRWEPGEIGEDYVVVESLEDSSLDLIGGGGAHGVGSVGVGGAIGIIKRMARVNHREAVIGSGVSSSSSTGSGISRSGSAGDAVSVITLELLVVCIRKDRRIVRTAPAPETRGSLGSAGDDHRALPRGLWRKFFRSMGGRDRRGRTGDVPAAIPARWRRLGSIGGKRLE